MRLITLIVLLIANSSLRSAYAEVAATSYDQLKVEFALAAAPDPGKLAQGWYSGRCFTEGEPSVVKSGVITVIPLADGKAKYVMPASSIMENDPARWDEIDDEELRVLDELAYAHRNDAAYLEGGSLVSMLTYEILVGKLYLREHEGSFYVKLTNAFVEDESTARTYFYCRLDRKAR
ncbi:MAG: hypothetical protein NDJ89_18055 [Oligoflexia bacterium]|nr:hypothetical protein [Oligoflexia bacterium]